MNSIFVYTQDKRTLVPVTEPVQAHSSGSVLLLTTKVPIGHITLGHYETVQRATEVLRGVVDAIHSDIRVYEMPER